MEITVKDILTAVSLLGSLVALVWYLRGASSDLSAKIDRLQVAFEGATKDLTEHDELLREARGGRAQLHEKMQEAQQRIVRLETKAKMGTTRSIS